MTVTTSRGVGRVSEEGLAAAALALARRFADDATLWCVSPLWPAHARHIAVEFVHPVIVGKRALPAVQVADDDPVAALRLVGRPGDLLAVVGPASDLGTELLVRAGTWGLTTLALGVGARPAARVADHEVWLEDVDPARAARSGRIVLCYHLLWELTHVVFEHPGLVREDRAGAGETCVTCADQATVAEVAARCGPDRAEVLARGRREVVDVSLVESAEPGDLVLVHAGVALSTLSATATTVPERTPA